MSQLLQNLRQDLQFAIRNLRKSPGFLVVVVLSLALGVGANSTIFSVMDAALYRPLPVPHPEQLVVIWDTEPGRPDSRQSPADRRTQRLARRQPFLPGHRTHQQHRRLILMAGVGAAERIDTQNVTPNYFSLDRRKA